MMYVSQIIMLYQFSSVTQLCLTLWPHGLQHARPPCLTPASGTCSNSCPSNQWCHPTISSSVVPLKYAVYFKIHSAYVNYISIKLEEKYDLLSFILIGIRSDQIRSVTQSCPTLCNPMNCSTPGLPVHHQLPEFTETHIHRVSDAIQPSHPLSSPSPLAPNPSQHQSIFQWVNSSHEVAKVLEFQL